MKKVFYGLILTILVLCSISCQPDSSNLKEPSAVSKLSDESAENSTQFPNQEYRMSPGPESQAFLFAEENTPYYGIPFDSPVNGTISNQLVRVEATVMAGKCPDCGESGWALINWGLYDAAIDTLCWVRLCNLRPYTKEDIDIITYPLKVKDGLTLQIRGKDVQSETLTEARVSKRSENTITLDWVGGNSCEVSKENIIFPNPQVVNTIDNEFTWDTIFSE